jgi:hypothetical protein
MSLRFISTEIGFHPGSEPNFVIRTEEHPHQAWVTAADPTFQQQCYDTAKNAKDCGLNIVVVCDTYIEQDEARRFYQGIISVELDGFCDPVILAKNPGRKTKAVAWPTAEK